MARLSLVIPYAFTYACVCIVKSFVRMRIEYPLTSRSSLAAAFISNSTLTASPTTNFYASFDTSTYIQSEIGGWREITRFKTTSQREAAMLRGGLSSIVHKLYREVEIWIIVLHTIGREGGDYSPLSFVRNRSQPARLSRGRRVRAIPRWQVSSIICQ